MSVAIEDILESVLDEVCRTRGQLPRILFVKVAPRIGMGNCSGAVDRRWLGARFLNRDDPLDFEAVLFQSFVEHD